MPTLSAFYGILIRMYFEDHAPAHFHAIYGEFEALVDIQNLTVIRGELPRRALQLTLDWAELHRADLLADWALCQSGKTPNPIPPLQ